MLPNLGNKMKDKMIPIFFLIIITSCHHPMSFAAADTECEIKNDNYEQVKAFNNSECYFVVKGALKKANTKLDNSTIEFNVTVARQICKNENATLPIVKSKEESLFIAKNYVHKPRVHSVVLGLQQYNGTKTGYHYLWDDGSNMTYTGLKKAAIDEYAHFTVLLNKASDRDGGLTWLNQVNTKSSHDIDVVCKKLHSKINQHGQVSAIASSIADAQLSEFQMQLTVCDIPDNSNYVKTIKVKNESCLFIVENATELSNVVKNNTNFFNITQAREICANHNATLPIIKSLDKNVILTENARASLYFISVLGGESQKILALGLKQTQLADNSGYSYEWDDGSKLDYEAIWKTKFHSASYTTLNISLGQAHLAAWTNVAAMTGGDSVVNVVCEQSYRSPTAPMPRTATKVCSQGNVKDYPRKEIYQNKFCYFTVAGAMAATHRYQREDSLLFECLFDALQAQQICENVGASLVFIKSKEEHDFINAKFKPRDFNESIFRGENFDKQPSTNFILLGLKQIKSISDYVWTNNDSLNYEPDTWKNKDIYATMIVKQIGKLIWENLDTNIALAPIGILCKQPYSPNDTVITRSALTLSTSQVVPTATIAQTVKQGTTSDSALVVDKKSPPHSTANNNKKMYTIFIILAGVISQIAK